MNLEIVGGTDEQQQSVRLMLASDPETSFSYLDASGEPYNHHRTDGLWVMGYGSWWPTWTVIFSPADTFSVDDWGPHAQGSATLNTDGSAIIQLADDLEVPMLYDVLMHMVGHIIIGYITQFDGPQDELTTAVGGTASYWDVSGDSVQEGVCEAFKDLALMGRRARDTLSRYQVTRGTISSLARTMNSDGADASHQVSGWGWHDGFYNQVNVGLSLPMTIVARTSSGPFTQLPVRDPDNTWTDGMESTPFGQADAPVALSATVVSWHEDADTGAVTGVDVAIGAHAPTLTPFTGKVHLTFQGWGLVRDTAETEAEPS